jgi:hypothetical protein
MVSYKTRIINYYFEIEVLIFHTLSLSLFFLLNMLYINYDVSLFGGTYND